MFLCVCECFFFLFFFLGGGGVSLAQWLGHRWFSWYVQGSNPDIISNREKTIKDTFTDFAYDNRKHFDNNKVLFLCCLFLCFLFCFLFVCCLFLFFVFLSVCCCFVFVFSYIKIPFMSKCLN